MEVSGINLVPARFRLQYQKALSKALYNKIGVLITEHQHVTARNNYEEAELLAKKIQIACEDYIDLCQGYKNWEELPTELRK